MQFAFSPGMDDKPGDVHAFSFGPYRLDLRREVLLCNGQEVSLRPKSFDVLVVLASHPGRVVSRDELFDAVWPDLVVTDDSLTQCLIEIRKALGDKNKETIRTVPRRGYLLDAEVRTEFAGRESSQPPFQSAVNPGRAPSRWTIAGFLILAIAIVATWWRTDFGSESTFVETRAWSPTPNSIAVLPFADMSEAGDQQYLAEGISEEILNLLAQSRGLTVIARTSSFAVSEQENDIPTIARRLNVANVLEGSVRKSGDRIRVTAQLVDGKTAVHLWSQTFDDEQSDVFAMQDRIAQGVADVLHVELAGEPYPASGRNSPNPDPHAWEAYLRGRLYYSRRLTGDIMRAQSSFEEAIDIDPEFADAWVSLAATYNLRYADEPPDPEVWLSQAEALPLIRSALERALDIDPNNPEALWRVSYFTWQSDGNVEKTLALLGRAIELGHNHALVQAMMAGFAHDTGDLALAVPIMRRAVMLDPISASHRGNLGRFLFGMGLWTEAEETIRQTMELRPGDARDNALLARVKIQQQDFDAAAEYTAGLPSGPDRDLVIAVLAHLRGDKASSDQAVDRLLALPVEEGSPYLAEAYAMRGDLDEAFRWLSSATRAIAESPLQRSGRRHLVNLEYSDFLQSLNDDPRWAVWKATADDLLLDDVDHQIVAMLREHVERHPELYDPGVRDPDLP